MNSEDHRVLLKRFGTQPPKENIMRFFSVLFLLMAMPLTGIAEDGTIRPVTVGDKVTYQNVAIDQATGMFSNSSSPSTFTFVTPGEPGHIEIVNDKNPQFRSVFRNNGGTQIVYRGANIPTDEQFVRFPPGETPRPGLEWEVPRITKPRKDDLFLTSAGFRSCGSLVLDYTASSEAGPPISIEINGQPTYLTRTVLVRYVAYPRSCTTTRPQRKTVEIVWSSELNWVIRARYTQYMEHTGIIDSGNGWDVTQVFQK